jgi:hypothetical protein
MPRYEVKIAESVADAREILWTGDADSREAALRLGRATWLAKWGTAVPDDAVLEVTLRSPPCPACGGTGVVHRYLSCGPVDPGMGPRGTARWVRCWDCAGTIRGAPG